jgi:hypothetical protein
MNLTARLHLPRAYRTVMIAAVVPSAWLLGAGNAFCAEPAAKPDDLDVTMQIIADPNAKLPDDVVRKIPLPARKTDAPAGQSGKGESDKGESNKGESNKGGSDKTQSALKEVGRDRSTPPPGQDVAERARERARDAAEQREQSRRAAEEREREHGPPKEPPGRPPGR